MEQLYMQFFERVDWVEAQVEQQADSYVQTVACSLLAAGHRPPGWLLPSYATEPQELNGKPPVPGLIFTGRQITTPATNRTVFLPPTVPSTFFGKSGVSNGYTYPDTNFAALDTDQHEKPQHEQASLNHEFSKTLVADGMFSRIQRSRSRKRDMEDRLRGRGEAAKSGSRDDMQDGVHRSKLANVGSNRTNASSSSSVSCGVVANNAETTSSRQDQGNGFCASQGRLTDSSMCHNNLENQGVQLDSFPSLIVEDKIVCSDSNAEVTNNCSVRDLLSVPLPDLSKLNDAKSVCHILPETHLLVEPKKLQFDGVESVCINPAREQTCQQPESGLESDQIDLSGRNPLSEEPSSTSSQGPHSMDRSLLDGVKSGHLNPDSAPVKQHHKDALECGHPDLTGMHSQNKEPLLTCSSEAPNAVGDPLLQKETQRIPETNSLGRACSEVSQPLEMSTSNRDETNCSERSCSVGSPLLGNDTVQTVEDNEKLRSSNSHVSPLPYSGPLQLSIQLADSRFGAQASSGILPNNLLREDGCDRLSNLLTKGINRRCSQRRFAVSLQQLRPQTSTSTDVCQSSPQSNDKHSNGRTAVNTFEYADNESSQDQSLLTRPSLECNGNILDADTPLSHPLDMQSEMLKGDLVSYSVNCHSEKLGDDAPVNKLYGDSSANRKNESVVSHVVPSISSGRTREMHETERNIVASPEKSIGSLRQGIEQVTPHVENAVQINVNSSTADSVEQIMDARISESCEKNNKLQAGKGNSHKRSVADGVQINGGTSSKRKGIKCQDITLPSSSNTNSLPLDHQDGIGTNVVTAENFLGKSQPSGRYCLRSSGFCEFMSLTSETRNGATNRKMSVASDVQENKDSSPRLRNRGSLSNAALCNSSNAKALSPNFYCGISSTGATEGIDFQNYQAQLQNIFDIATTSAVPSCSNIAPDNMECCIQEEHPCLEGKGVTVTNSRVERHQMAPQMDKMLSQSAIFNPENYSTDSTNILPKSYALDQHGIKASAPIALAHEKLSYGSGVKLDRKCKSEDLTGCLSSDATIPEQKGDESVGCSDTMPQFKSFDFSVPFDSPTTGKTSFEMLCDSGQFSTLSSDIAKMNTESGMHQLLASMSRKSTNCSFHDDVRQRSASNDGSIEDIFGSCVLGPNNLFFTSDVIASSSSDASNNQENNENPLTPAVEKYNLGKLSARVGSISEHMGSIPELSCFRIDEDSGIEEENEYQDIVAGSVGNQWQSGRKALQDITGLCKNTWNSASYSIGAMDTIETCSSELNHHSDPRNNEDKKKSKGSGVSLVKREGKVSHFPYNRLSKIEVINNKNQRHMSEANLSKQSKPSNIVANVASFIPLVKPKGQLATSCVKKDVRVKALEAAEAAKRLEEKKRNEREMRKAAAKLEREKMKQEKELKQKQEEEHKKKRDADVATRKRQRDEDERREKERKRKCAEDRKQQKQPMERRHANDEKDVHPKAPANKGLQKNLVEAMKSQVKPDETTGLGYKATKSNNEKVEVVHGMPANFGSNAKENIPNSFEESYMMTPYKDSDGEDDDDFYCKEELRRRRKMTPSWVREENLVNILFHNQTLDAKEIFAQKCSFNLSDVLPVHVPQRGFR